MDLKLKLKPVKLDPGNYQVKTLPSGGQTPQVLTAKSIGDTSKLSFLNLYH